jgi:CrcB protein
VTWVWIGVAGAAGALARFMVGAWLSGRGDRSVLPWGTFVVNMLGSFLLGLLTGSVLARGAVSPTMKLVLGTGFMGAFTTFSTWQHELFRTYAKGDRRAAWINLLVSTGVGLMVAWAGVVAGWRL